MLDLLWSIDRVLTWRRLALVTIPVIWLAVATGMSIELILALSFNGVIASILSLRGQEGDV